MYHFENNTIICCQNLIPLLHPLPKTIHFFFEKKNTINISFKLKGLKKFKFSSNSIKNQRKMFFIKGRKICLELI